MANNNRADITSRTSMYCVAPISTEITMQFHKLSAFSLMSKQKQIHKMSTKEILNYIYFPY